MRSTRSRIASTGIAKELVSAPAGQQMVLEAQCPAVPFRNAVLICGRQVPAALRLASLAIFLLGVFMSTAIPSYGDTPTDINTVMMRSTFKIEGGGTLGTIFIMGAPDPAAPDRVRFVLITATHVLRDIPGPSAVLHLRRRKGATFERLPFAIPIRDKGLPLWTSHPDLDVSVMPVALPLEADLPLASTDLLATDDMLAALEIRPGDTLVALGFPFGAESSDVGFPVLRSARISSYPILPTVSTKTLLLDSPLFPGNSGGPVFLYSENRVMKGGTHIGVSQCMVGVVSEERTVDERLQGIDQVTVKKHRLGLAVVVHAAFVRQLVGQLFQKPSATPPRP